MGKRTGEITFRVLLELYWIKQLKLKTYCIIIFVLLFFALTTSLGQTCSLSGQASGWIMVTHDNTVVSQPGLRYIPDFSLKQKLNDDLNADMDLSLNTYTTESFMKSQHPENDMEIKPYRASFRLASDVFEARVGLQKISFGTATLFRPLMWFDKIDPRDPLQLTDGVYGMLMRYYFMSNANIWLWGLYGNNETKGWETFPTQKKSIEFGGRVQLSVWDGEAGLSYHHREADLSNLPGILTDTAGYSVPENRFALDGKWDIGIGVWFEAVIIHQQTEIPGMKYQRLWTLGADYTFDIGNGLTVLTEYFRDDHPNNIFGPTDGIGFSGLSLNYSLGTLDRISAMFYRDWTDQDWYRLFTIQRTYDNWIIYFIGFWNPNNMQLYRIQGGTNPFAGTGLQVMLVFNH